MKPSVILYKALPDDLLQRLQEHFTVHQVANLSPQTVEQNAAISAFSSTTGPRPALMKMAEDFILANCSAPNR